MGLCSIWLLSSDSLNFFDWLMGGQRYPRKQKGEQARLESEDAFTLDEKRDAWCEPFPTCALPGWDAATREARCSWWSCMWSKGDHGRPQHKDHQSSNAPLICWTNPKTSSLQTGRPFTSIHYWCGSELFLKLKAVVRIDLSSLFPSLNTFFTEGFLKFTQDLCIA